mgnify:CR=1 FL=1
MKKKLTALEELEKKLEKLCVMYHISMWYNVMSQKYVIAIDEETHFTGATLAAAIKVAYAVRG